MLQRSYIEQILKLNGVAATAPDHEIKSILLSARWHEKDVETALLVLRENTTNHETQVDSVHRTFRADDQLKPETISALLGVEVNVLNNEVSVNKKRRRLTVSISQLTLIGVISLMISAALLFSSMWYMQMGIFHITMR